MTRNFSFCSIFIATFLFSSLNSIAQKNFFKEKNIGFQFKLYQKHNTFSGKEFDPGTDFGRKGFYVEINKQWLDDGEMGRLNQSIGIGFRQTQIKAKDLSQEGTYFDITTVEIPYTMGFFMHCPPCGIITSIPVGLNFGVHLAVPLKYDGMIREPNFSGSGPAYTEYTFGNKYEKPLTYLGVHGNFTFNINIKNVGILRLLYGFNMGVIPIMLKAPEDVIIPYKTPLPLGVNFGLEYVFGSH